MPLLDLPLVLQKDSHSCGAAVFRCVTNYWDGKGKRIKSHPHYGTHPDALELAFHAAKYHVLAGGMDVDALKLLTARGWPVCCLVKRGGDGHWVAVRGVVRNRVHLMDPAEGLVSVPVGEWVERWSDFDRRGTVFSQYGLSVWC